MWKGYVESEVRESETSDDADVVVVVVSAAAAPVTTDSWNPNMEVVELWYGIVNLVFSVMRNVIF